jgi:hypothetical protein
MDHCVASDLRPKVDVNGVQPGATSVDNTLGDDGCTVQDLVNACAAQAKNHGQYVSCITHLANELKAAGFITDAQKAEMTKGAAKSKAGKK